MLQALAQDDTHAAIVTGSRKQAARYALAANHVVKRHEANGVVPFASSNSVDV